MTHDTADYITKNNVDDIENKRIYRPDQASSNSTFNSTALSQEGSKPPFIILPKVSQLI